jgi:hypothetical protein
MRLSPLYPEERYGPSGTSIHDGLDKNEKKRGKSPMVMARRLAAMSFTQTSRPPIVLQWSPPYPYPTRVGHRGLSGADDNRIGIDIESQMTTS